MAFGKLPGSAELKSMSVRRVRAIFEIWERRPPVHRSLAMLLAAQTTWKPAELPAPRGAAPPKTTPEELFAFAAKCGMRIMPTSAMK